MERTLLIIFIAGLKFNIKYLFSFFKRQNKINNRLDSESHLEKNSSCFWYWIQVQLPNFKFGFPKFSWVFFCPLLICVYLSVSGSTESFTVVSTLTFLAKIKIRQTWTFDILNLKVGIFSWEFLIKSVLNTHLFQDFQTLSLQRSVSLFLFQIHVCQEVCLNFFYLNLRSYPL